MSGCCDSSDYEDVFSDKRATKDLKSYRRKGLDRLAKAMVEFLGPDAAGATVLEVGGGIGAIQNALLDHGAASAVNIELSKGYETAAMDLAAEAGVVDKVQRVHGDFVEMTVAPADIVVMNRVVCCYPDMEAMMAAAADRATSTLAMVFPRDRWFMRALRRIIAVERRLRRNTFRFYVHDPDLIVGEATARGLKLSFTRRTAGWQAVILQRSP
ncbi:MAG: methyltransferase [Acidimicrobiia bacterium]